MSVPNNAASLATDRLVWTRAKSSTPPPSGPCSPFARCRRTEVPTSFGVRSSTDETGSADSIATRFRHFESVAVLGDF